MRAFIAAFWLLLLGLQANAAEPSAVRARAFVLLSEARLPDAGSYRTALEERLKGRMKIDAIDADGKKVILLRINGGTLVIGLIDAPLPKGQIDDLCRGAWYWRTACDDTAKHAGHVYVSLLDTQLDKLDAYLLLTDAVATLMDGNSIASYWGASLQSREAFLKQSARAGRESPPVWLWMNFRVSNDMVKGFSISTQGMEDFDLREIEAKDVNRKGMEVFTLLMGMARYLVQKGPVIKDGETIGDSPALNIQVWQGPSYWREGARVYRVVFPKD